MGIKRCLMLVSRIFLFHIFRVVSLNVFASQMILCEPKLEYPSHADNRWWEKFCMCKTDQLLRSKFKTNCGLAPIHISHCIFYFFPPVTLLCGNAEWLDVLILTLLFSSFCLHTCCSFCVESPLTFTSHLMSSGLRLA